MDLSPRARRALALVALSTAFASSANLATAQPPSSSSQPAVVGEPPAETNQAPPVAPLFEQPGILTPRHEVIFESSGPSFTVALGVGATRDTPDITLTLRVRGRFEFIEALKAHAPAAAPISDAQRKVRLAAGWLAGSER